MGEKMSRFLVNDTLSTLDHHTFWHDLLEWFEMRTIEVPFDRLANAVDVAARTNPPSLIIRNASYFGPIAASSSVPTISLLQDIFLDGPGREMQYSVLESSAAVVFNSKFTESKYLVRESEGLRRSHVIPLPVNTNIFEPMNAMGLQQALSLPRGSVCWVGACREAGQIKGWDILSTIARANPDIHFVCVFKDHPPEYGPPNVRLYPFQKHEELVKIMGACHVGLCTSRTESQHLAGIEMGVCGLPLVVPKVGIYWERENIPGEVCNDLSVESLTAGIRKVRERTWDRPTISDYWSKDFSPEVAKSAWSKLIEEVECSGAS